MTASRNASNDSAVYALHFEVECEAATNGAFSSSLEPADGNFH